MTANKIKLKLTNKQKTYCKKACGISRLAWNWGVINWKEQYKESKVNENVKRPNGMDLKKKFNAIKKEEFPFINEVTKYACQQPFLNLQKSYNKFFKDLSLGIKAHKPKLHKKGKKDSFYMGGDVIEVRNREKRVKIPKLGFVKLTEELRDSTHSAEGLPMGKILSATISREADNWFISFTIEQVICFDICENQTYLKVGVDLGIKTLAVLSNGETFELPKKIKQSNRRSSKMGKKLSRESRRLSRKQHSRSKNDNTVKSNNYKKQQIKVAKVHARIANIRKDALHKLTTYITKNFKNISIEDLNIKGMLANRKLSRAISELGLYEFRRQLEYKSVKRGNNLIIVDRFFPSSKTCSCCGNVKETLLLSERMYKCTECGFILDRDLNAAINLENQIPLAQREFTTAEI